MQARFSYVKYDKEHTEAQERFKEAMEEIEAGIEKFGPCRAGSLALTKLEETYMWIGKMIRDDQINSNVAHEPSRTNE